METTTKCSECEGDGILLGVKCAVCHGTGLLTERDREMIESPAYRLGVATEIIRGLIRGDARHSAWFHEHASEFLRDEDARAAKFGGKA